jgi:predicted metalloprotease with PDZ domain
MNRFIIAAVSVLTWLLVCQQVLVPASGQTAGNAYSIEFVDLEQHQVQITARFPTAGADTLTLMMPIWSPGFYAVQDYSSKVLELTATSEGTELTVTRPRSNRWQIACGSEDEVRVTYRLECQDHFVTTNWAGTDFAVLNGCATFIVPVDGLQRPCTVTVHLPETWDGCQTGMNSLGADPRQPVFTAANYDILVDSPIIAGDIQSYEFTVDGSRHVWADLGEIADWNGAEAAANAEKIVTATSQFWGELPFDRYVFLNVFRRGGGGLEHLNSTLLTANRMRGGSSWGWLAFVSHEYFHAFNVKRLRPIELGPFDYEHPPRTPSLWISEGLTTYFGNLMVVRGGIGGTEDFLASMSDLIRQLQNNPGRLRQSLQQASLQVWELGQSGVAQNNGTSVSYYVKGPVAGFLLDAKIRAATGGQKSLDDVMRAAYDQYSGERGFTEQQYRDLASSVAGIDLNPWFHQAIDSPGELDYREMLDWYGLRFTGGEDPKSAWTLAPIDDASPEQVERLKALTRPYEIVH